YIGNESYTHQELGVVIDENGVTQSNITLGFLNMTDGDPSELGYAVVNADSRYGFIWVNFQKGSEVKWKLYTYEVYDSNEIQLNGDSTASGQIPSPIEDCFVISTADDSYCFVTVERNENASYLWSAYVSFLRPNASQVTSKIFLFGHMYRLQLKICSETNYEPGAECIIEIEANNTSYLRVTFLTTGAVKDIFAFHDTFGYSVNQIITLFDGQYLLVGSHESGNGTNSSFMGIYDSTGSYLYSLDSSKFPEVNNDSLLYGASPNKTVLMVYDLNTTTNGDLKYFTFDVTSSNNSGQKNVYDDIAIQVHQNVDSVTPDTQNINITFPIAVVPSTGNISIYEIRGPGNMILKQSYSAQDTMYVKTPNNETLELTVLRSTFFTLNTNYSVVMENNFVKDASDYEPFLGTFRILTTGMVDESPGGDERGLVRLTEEASNEYWGKRVTIEPFKNLTRELCTILFFSPCRLQLVGRWQWDSNRQIILKIEISNSANGRSVNSVALALDSLIRNKNVSSVSWYPTTLLLDSEYGFQVTETVWEQYKYNLFGVGSVLLLCAVLALLSYGKYGEGNGFIVFRILLIGLDFVLDVLFVTFYAQDIYMLFYPTLAFTIASIAFNTLIGFIVIIREITKNDRFAKLGGFRAFSAPLSNEAKRWIYWSSIVNLVIEDMPQLVIQIAYIILCVNYKIIPFLNLVTASLLFFVLVLGKLYQLYRRLTDDDDHISDRGSVKSMTSITSIRSVSQRNGAVMPPPPAAAWRPLTHAERNIIPDSPLARGRQNFGEEGRNVMYDGDERMRRYGSKKDKRNNRPINVDDDNGERSRLLDMDGDRRRSITITHPMEYGGDGGRGVFGDQESLQSDEDENDLIDSVSEHSSDDNEPSNSRTARGSKLPLGVKISTYA
ncbi:10539_t:CDS:10, partial [Acaulospora colombiana]